ncbi:MAG TPA: EamA family transporter [Propionicimonas sp.]|nr:EamA family transporter [Propionicimonas sp.]
MRPRDRLLAATVPVLWGINFPATALALAHWPPFLGGALRFALLALPTLLFVPRPAVKWRWILAMGLTLGVGQFAFLYLAMANGMPSGLASLVLQASAPFTVVLGVVLLGERMSLWRAVGVGMSVSGLAMIALDRSHAAPLPAVLLTLAGGLSWALGNLSSRQAKPDRPLALTLWMSVVPPLPLFALSWVFEGPDRIGTAFATALTPAALPANLGLLYIVLAATVLGYGIWNTLLSRYPSAQVAPWSMLVPVVGVLASWAAFDEVPGGVEIAAGALVVTGVLVATGALRPPVRPPAELPSPAGEELESRPGVLA